MWGVCALLVNAVSVEQEETKQAVFVAVEKFLFGSLARAEFDAPESDAEIEDAGPRVLDRLEAEEYEDAYEMLYSLVQKNDLSDTIFLGLAFTNYHLNYPEAAEKYASQAAMLHGVVSDGSEAELLETYAKTLSRIADEWRNSKIIVNDRFTHLISDAKTARTVQRG